MSFWSRFMNPDFDYHEKLYRKVIIKPDFWKKSTGQPSSAVFKDSKGVSVDRDGGRLQNQVIDAFKNRFGEENMKALVSVTIEYCTEVDVFLKYAPIPDNKYHTEIHNTPTEIRLTSAKARKLAKNCNVVWENNKLN